MSEKLIGVFETDFEHEDDRGSLVQIIHDGYKQVNVITSKAGALRGGHYHRKNDEAFYIVSGSLRLDASKDGLSESRVFKQGDFFGIGPDIMHSFFFTEDTVLVSFYSNGVELPGGAKDIYTE